MNAKTKETARTCFTVYRVSWTYLHAPVMSIVCRHFKTRREANKFARSRGMETEEVVEGLRIPISSPEELVDWLNGEFDETPF